MTNKAKIKFGYMFYGYTICAGFSVITCIIYGHNMCHNSCIYFNNIATDHLNADLLSNNFTAVKFCI